MKIKEIRTCKICPNKFKVRTTSTRLNCCTRCSIAYLQLPEVKAKVKARRQSLEYKTKMKAYRHIKNQMKINKQYPCKICNEIFEFNYQRKQHMVEHRI